MSDETVQVYRAMDEHRKALRQKFGAPCPECRRLQPKRNPTILMPKQICRVDGYVDRRPDLTDEEWASA